MKVISFIQLTRNSKLARLNLITLPKECFIHSSRSTSGWYTRLTVHAIFSSNLQGLWLVVLLARAAVIIRALPGAAR